MSWNSLIDKNQDRISKSLKPRLPGGPQVLCQYAENGRTEAQWIAEKAQALHEEQGVPYRDMTILYRAHYLTRNLEEAFQKKEVPFTIYSGVQFFDRAEVKDALAYLRMISQRDDLSFLRIVNTPKRNIGKKRIALLTSFAEANGCTLYQALLHCCGDEAFRGTGAAAFIELVEHYTGDLSGLPVSEVLSSVLDRSGYEKMLRTEGSQTRLDNLAELKQSIFDFETSCGEECDINYYLSHVALFTNSDAADTGDKVKFMTVHAAKGLEFPYVFLCALNEGTFPTRRTNTLAGMEEERRLAFVAMTRAEKALFLTTAEGRNLDGSPRYPSRFLLDIDEGLLAYDHAPSETLIKDARRMIGITDRNLLRGDEESLFPIGTRVRHVIFGTGMITDIDPDKGTYEIQFDGLVTPRVINWRVKMEKLPSL